MYLKQMQLKSVLFSLHYFISYIIVYILLSIHIIISFYISLFPCRDQFWPFIHCMDEEGQAQDLEVGSKCAKQQGLDWDKIKTCTDGSLGTQLQMEAFNTTANLSPPHRYTPWVTVNGQVRDDTYYFTTILIIAESITRVVLYILYLLLSWREPRTTVYVV